MRFISPDPDLSKSSGYARARRSARPTAARRATRAAPPWARPSSTTCSRCVRAPPSAATAAGSIAPATRSRRTARCSCRRPIATGITQPNANYTETTTARIALKWKVNDSLEIMPVGLLPALHGQRHRRLLDIDVERGRELVPQRQCGTNPSDDPFTLSAIKVKWDLGFASLYSNTSYYNREPARDLGLHAVSARHLVVDPLVRPGGREPQRLQPAEHLRAARRQRLRAVSGQPAQLLSGIPPGLERRRLAPAVDRRDLLLASDRERARVHHRSDTQPGNRQLERRRRAVLSDRTSQSVQLPERSDSQSADPGGGRQAGRAVRRADLQDHRHLEGDRRRALLEAQLQPDRVARHGAFIGASTTDSYNSGNDNPVTPKAVLTWQPDHDNMMYLSAVKGFRPGGLNGPVGSICAPSLTSLGLDSRCPASSPPTACGATSSAARMTSWSQAGGRPQRLLHRLEPHPAECLPARVRRAVHGQPRQGQEQGRRAGDPLPAGAGPDL